MKNSKAVSLSVLAIALLYITIIGSCKKESKATCTDGIKNGNEKSVDCGDSCFACPDYYNLLVNSKWQLTTARYESDSTPFEVLDLNDTTLFVRMTFDGGLAGDTVHPELKLGGQDFLFKRSYTLHQSILTIVNNVPFLAYRCDNFYKIMQLNSSTLKLWNNRNNDTLGPVILEMTRL